MNTPKNDGFVGFGDVARSRCKQQCQYVSRYVPNLGEGLRFRGEPSDYHFLEIHKDDVNEFVRRYKNQRKAILAGRPFVPDWKVG